MMLKWLHFFCVLVIFSFCGCSKNHESKEQGILIRGKIEDVDSEFRVIHFVKLDKEAQLKLEKLLVTKDEDWFAFEKKLWILINTFDIKTAKIIKMYNIILIIATHKYI